jgi:hypothetical protein
LLKYRKACKDAHDQTLIHAASPDYVEGDEVGVGLLDFVLLTCQVVHLEPRFAESTHMHTRTVHTDIVSRSSNCSLLP